MRGQFGKEEPSKEKQIEEVEQAWTGCSRTKTEATPQQCECTHARVSARVLYACAEVLDR